MLPQLTYIASVLDPANSTYDEINKIIGLFINTGTSKPCTQKNWIHKDILYGPKSEGGLNFIDARSFFLSLKISWVKDMYRMHLMINGLISFIFNSMWTEPTGVKSLVGEQKPSMTW